MGVTRRAFLKLAVGAWVIGAAPILRILGRVLPTRYVKAVRARFYPGPQKTGDGADVARPARWAG